MRNEKRDEKIILLFILSQIYLFICALLWSFIHFGVNIRLRIEFSNMATVTETGILLGSFITTIIFMGLIAWLLISDVNVKKIHQYITA